MYGARSPGMLLYRDELFEWLFKFGSLKSLHLMLETFPDCPGGIVFYSGVYKELPDQRLSFLPLYNVSALCDYS